MSVLTNSSYERVGFQGVRAEGRTVQVFGEGKIVMRLPMPRGPITGALFERPTHPPHRFDLPLGRVPAITLAASNVMSLFGLHRRHRGALHGGQPLRDLDYVLPLHWDDYSALEVLTAYLRRLSRNVRIVDGSPAPRPSHPPFRKDHVGGL